MLKIDDDVFLALDDLIYFLQENKTLPQNFIMGRVLQHKRYTVRYNFAILIFLHPFYFRPLHDYNALTANNISWYMPKYIYSSAVYPDYVEGPVYLVSRQAAEDLVRGL